MMIRCQAVLSYRYHKHSAELIQRVENLVSVINDGNLALLHREVYNYGSFYKGNFAADQINEHDNHMNQQVVVLWGTQ